MGTKPLILRAIKEGKMNTKDIAKKFNCTTSYVRCIASDNGISLSKPYVAPKETTLEVVKEGNYNYKIDKNAKQALTIKDCAHNVIKGVFCCDLHIPNHSESCVELFLMFVKDFQPKVIILGGDILSLDIISHWNEKNLGMSEGKRLASDFDIANKILDRIQATCPNSEIIYMEGNHEFWLEDAMQKNPQLQGFWDLSRNLKFKERGIRHIGQNATVNFGRLYFIHGIYTGTNHAKKTADAFEKSIRYGHTHDVQFYTKLNPINNRDFHTAASSGCMCELNPTFMKNKPSAWIHGFRAFYVDMKTGGFADYQIIIAEKQFVWNGKVYKV